MSRDRELPSHFQKLNKFGVPTWGMSLATIIPATLVVLVSDVAGLADLYAVGVVGAIATNLGASSTDKKLPLKKWERVLMFCTFIVMLAIEISLLISKPSALHFRRRGARGRADFARPRARARAEARDGGSRSSRVRRSRRGDHGEAECFRKNRTRPSGSAMLAAVRGIGRTLDFAIEEARETDRPLYLLFVREQPAIADTDRKRKWHEDAEARDIFAYAADKADGHTVLPCYAVSDSPADTIVDIAATVGAARLILGAPQRNTLVNLLRGNLVRQVADILPEDIHMIVYA